MGEFKGTKGKWIMNKTSDEYRDQEVIDIDGEKESSFVTVWSGGHIDEVTQANALLISKAPEMLEMLQELFNLLEENQAQANFYTRGHYEKLNKLIKEATEVTES